MSVWPRIRITAVGDRSFTTNSLKINKSFKPLLKIHKLTFTKNLVVSLEKPCRSPKFGTQNQSRYQFEETSESLAKLENRGLLLWQSQ